MVLAATGAPASAQSRSTTTTVKKPSSTAEANERKSDIDTRIKTLKQQVEHASAAETDLLGRLDQVAAKKRSLDARLRALDAQIVTVEAELADASTELAGVESALRRASAKLADAEQGLERANGELVERAVDAYMVQPSARAANMLLEGRGELRDVAAVQTFLRRQVEDQRVAIKQYVSLRRKLETEHVGLVVAREQYAEQREQVREASAELLAARTEQDEVRRQVATEEAAEQRLLSDVRKQVKDFEAQIAALKKESEQVAAFLRARQTGKPIAAGSGVFGRPVNGPITSTFGPRQHPIFETTRMHTGVDFGSPSGTPIKAAGAGEVIWAGERGGYGTVVIIDHGGSTATLYAHQSRVAVKDGATVTRGQTIGYVGSTGYSTGPHLHFEVRVGGNPVDPLRYL